MCHGKRVVHTPSCQSWRISRSSSRGPDGRYICRTSAQGQSNHADIMRNNSSFARRNDPTMLTTPLPAVTPINYRTVHRTEKPMAHTCLAKRKTQFLRCQCYFIAYSNVYLTDQQLRAVKLILRHLK
eukprot:scpid60184/ scgid8622/ 